MTGYISVVILYWLCVDVAHSVPNRNELSLVAFGLERPQECTTCLGPFQLGCFLDCPVKVPLSDDKLSPMCGPEGVTVMWLYPVMWHYTLAVMYVKEHVASPVWLHLRNLSGLLGLAYQIPSIASPFLCGHPAKKKNDPVRIHISLFLWLTRSCAACVYASCSWIRLILYEMASLGLHLNITCYAMALPYWWCNHCCNYCSPRV